MHSGNPLSRWRCKRGMGLRGSLVAKVRKSAKTATLSSRRALTSLSSNTKA